MLSLGGQVLGFSEASNRAAELQIPAEAHRQVLEPPLLMADGVDKDPRAAYFRQVRYGRYIRMALIMKLLGIE